MTIQVQEQAVSPRGSVGHRAASILLRGLDHLEEWLIAALMGAATALIFFAVVHRYGTGLSINGAKWAEAHGIPLVPILLRAIDTPFPELDVSWAQELCIFMFIWMAKSAPHTACEPAFTWASMSSSICCPPRSASG